MSDHMNEYHKSELRVENERLRKEVDRLKQALTVEGDTLLNAQYWSERLKEKNKLLNDVYEHSVYLLEGGGQEVVYRLRKAIAAVQGESDE